MTTQPDDEKPIGIGDLVEVKFQHVTEGEIWRLATIVYVRDDSIGVSFSDGQRMAVLNRQGLWRRL